MIIRWPLQVRLDMTLEEIQNEIMLLYEKAQNGETIDEKRFDLLLEAQQNDPEYIAILAEERDHWRQSIAVQQPPFIHHWQKNY